MTPYQILFFPESADSSVPPNSILKPQIVNITTAITSIMTSNAGRIESILAHQKFCGQKRKLHLSALFSEIDVALREVNWPLTSSTLLSNQSVRYELPVKIL